MLRLAFHHGLRVICPIRAGYGHSDHLPGDAELFSATLADTLHLLNELGIERLPYAAQGTDFPLMVDFAAHQSDRVSALFALGGKPCLPGSRQIDGAGRWQRFFLSTARSAPHLVRFASGAVMAMSKRIGPEKMLRQLCKESEADLAVLEDEATRKVLEANIGLMAGPGTNAAQAFAREYVAFQSDWSAQITMTKHIPTTVFLAAQDPTTNIGAIPKYEEAFPWLKIETFPDAGLALLFQKPNDLIPRMAEAAGEV